MKRIAIVIDGDVDFNLPNVGDVHEIFSAASEPDQTEKLANALALREGPVDRVCFVPPATPLLVNQVFEFLTSQGIESRIFSDISLGVYEFPVLPLLQLSDFLNNEELKEPTNPVEIRVLTSESGVRFARLEDGSLIIFIVDTWYRLQNVGDMAQTWYVNMTKNLPELGSNSEHLMVDSFKELEYSLLPQIGDTLDEETVLLESDLLFVSYNGKLAVGLYDADFNAPVAMLVFDDAKLLSIFSEFLESEKSAEQKIEEGSAVSAQIESEPTLDTAGADEDAQVDDHTQREEETATPGLTLSDFVKSTAQNNEESSDASTEEMLDDAKELVNDLNEYSDMVDAPQNDKTFAETVSSASYILRSPSYNQSDTPPGLYDCKDIKDDISNYVLLSTICSIRPSDVPYFTDGTLYFSATMWARIKRLAQRFPIALDIKHEVV